MKKSRRDFLRATVVTVAGSYAINSHGITMDDNVKTIIVKGTDAFPNNDRLPLIVYKAAFKLETSDPALEIEKIFLKNGWGNNWRNGIYTFHHYHSLCHEFIGVFGGHAKIQFGGPDGQVLKVEKGDALVIPAGVSHKKISSTPYFRVTGAYPAGQSPDMKYGKKSERPQADKNIKNVLLPKADPVFGTKGPLIKQWSE